MSKDMPVSYEERTRLPWDADYYELRLIGAEERPNKFYDPEPHIDRNGNEVPGDSQIFEKNWNLKFEVVKGDKAGDWLFVNFVSKYFRIKKDGEIVGKLPKIAMALDPSLTLETIATEGIDIESQIGQVCRGSVEPKDGGKYANVTAWAKSKLTTEERLELMGATVTSDMSDEDIPF